MKAYVTSNISLEFAHLTEEIEEIMEEEMVNLHNDLIDVGEAVRDTGNFKMSFSKVQNLKPYVWSIENDAHSERGFHYASILARGRMNVGGKWYGSIHWAKGLTVMVRATERAIQRRVSEL